MAASSYFAVLQGPDLLSALLDRKEQYYRHLSECGRSALLRRVYHYFNKSVVKGGALTRSGSLGQYTMINVNHFRNLVDHRKSLLVNQRPAYDAKAINGDSKSEAQVVIANGLLEYYGKTKKLDRRQEYAAEIAIKYGESFLYVGWDVMGGKEYGTTETGAIINEGDLEFEAYTTFDVIRDVQLRAAGQDKWFLVRRRKNKYDVIARHPGLKEEDQNSLLGETLVEAQNPISDFEEVSRTLAQDGDILNEWTFYHVPCAAVPTGRLFTFTEGGVILFDGPLPYRRLPILRMSAGELENSPFGTSNSFDLIPLQEALDKLYSIAVTNNAAFGVQNVAIPRGSGLTLTKIAGNLNYLEYDAKFGKPEPLQLTASSPELYNLIDRIEQKMETLSGINSAARGEPDSNLRSANSVALVQTMAIQFAQALQISYVHMLEDSAMMVIENLQDYAVTPRLAEIVGIGNRTYLKEFTRQDLSEILRVAVDIGNPLSKTIAGRSDIANNMLQYGLLTSPQQYNEVLVTGRLEPITKGPFSEMVLIRQENEALLMGQPMQALIIDNHALHIPEHLAVANDLKIRNNPQQMNAILQHIAMHQSLAMASMGAQQGAQGQPDGAAKQPNQARAKGPSQQIERPQIEGPVKE